MYEGRVKLPHAGLTREASFVWSFAVVITSKLSGMATICVQYSSYTLRIELDRFWLLLIYKIFASLCTTDFNSLHSFSGHCNVCLRNFGKKKKHLDVGMERSYQSAPLPLVNEHLMLCKILIKISGWRHSSRSLHGMKFLSFRSLIRNMLFQFCPSMSKFALIDYKWN